MIDFHEDESRSSAMGLAVIIVILTGFWFAIGLWAGARIAQSNCHVEAEQYAMENSWAK